jgi:feruloyl-CoA synthase
VGVGAIRTALLAAAPVLADAVIVGENRDRVCALAWLNLAEAQTLFGEDLTVSGDVVEHAGLAAHLASMLSVNEAGGSASRVDRLMVLIPPPELDAGEITDKGYGNQRRVLANRARFVELLYADPLPPYVIGAPVTTPC